MTQGKKPRVTNGVLHEPDGATIALPSPGWVAWLAQHAQFHFQGAGGHFSARKEQRRGGDYWYAYRRRDGKLHKAYLGKSAELTPARLEAAAADLAGDIPLPAPARPARPAAPAPTSFSAQTKIRPATLPPHLVTRTRLTDQMVTPVILISAPGGYGKSTLLNAWRQARAPLPVAWVALDADDDHLLRFWTTVVTALQTVVPAVGEALLPALRRQTDVEPTAIAARVSNALPGAADGAFTIGLVLDNFHHIRRADVLLSLQSWLARLPPGLQLVIAGRTRPPLELGRLRALGIVTELEQDDLRFTPAEGIAFLQQHLAEPLPAYSELERLVKRTDGWAAGLKLAAVAFSKQRDQPRFSDTFSGAHLYVRDYFLETALQQQSPAVQTFLLQTSILKQLTGALCDAVTGRSDGAQLLAQLWQENLFVNRAEEQAWYHYHDLFAEMLRTQLRQQLPDQLPVLHRRAADWYRRQNASADAVRHLLAINAWEEAASVIEEVALHQLVEYGEDSSLLRWMQQLPEAVFRRHRTLLFTYLRLARLALPAAEIERVLGRLESDLALLPSAQLTREERDVLLELRALRHNQYRTAFAPGREDARWQLIDSMRLFKPYHEPPGADDDAQVWALYEQARLQGNLFIVLLAGAHCANRAYLRGALRESEQIAQQVLHYALARRGKLPEPASVALTVLCRISLERNELGRARQLLQQTADVDPDPTSSNMLVSVAIVRARLQAADGDHAAARTTLQAARALHARRPSGVWRDADLAVYEALFCLPLEEWAAVNRLLGEGAEADHPLGQLVRAEMWLRQGRADSAESLLRALLHQPTAFEPLLAVRVLLALALYAQHKPHQACQTLLDALRLAQPERFVRPFLDHAGRLLPLLALLQHTEPPAGKLQPLIAEIAQAAGASANRLADALPQATLAALTTASSITERELAVLRLVRDGRSNQEIGRRLTIASGTVKTHLANIYRKLDVHNRVQAVAAARALGLL